VGVDFPGRGNLNDKFRSGSRYSTALFAFNLLFLSVNVNLLAPKFYFAHPVYKMQKYRTNKKVKLLNKRHFEEKELESVQHFLKKIQYVYFFTK
jgi:hypothetical protein